MGPHKDDKYDWILVGGGLCGAALAYELIQYGDSVLLIDPNPTSPGATRYSYGGIAYWAGTSELTQTLCHEAIARHPQLSDELEFDTQFQQRSLLLTVEAGQDPAAIATRYESFMIQPEVLSRTEALEREPLLNPEAIAGALCLPHGHVSPLALVTGYRRAFERLGGITKIGQVTDILQDGRSAENRRACGVQVTEDRISERILGDRVILCAGAWTRRLLKQQNLSIPLYFTHAELIETPPAPFEMQTLVMPAVQQRFALEAEAGSPTQAQDWESDQTGQTILAPILDAGLVQFADGHCCLGQISRAQTSLTFQTNATESSQHIREAVGRVLPCSKPLTGQWISTCVAFSQDGLPLVGEVPNMENLLLFSGFSSPFVYVLPVAQRFAKAMYKKQNDALVTQLSPQRFLPK